MAAPIASDSIPVDGCTLSDMSSLLEAQPIAPSEAVAAAPPLSLAILRDWDQIEQLRPEWNAILERNRRLTIFSTPEWLSAWWGAYGADKELHCLTFRDDGGALVGLLPLYREQIRSGFVFPVQRLRLVGDGSGDSDNLDFIVAPGFERAVVKAVLAHLQTERRWSVCELNCLASDSPSSTALLQQIESLDWKRDFSAVPWSAVDLPESWEAYLKQLSPKERGKVGNRLRRLESRHATRFHKCSKLEDLPDSLEKLFHLHQKRWELRGEPGSFDSSARRRFYDDMARQFLSRQWLELWLFEMDGVAVAAQYGFRYGNTVYSLQEGFDPDYASDSVGYVLRSHALREFIEGGVRRYDFLAGQNESKLRWGGVSGNYLNLHFARPRSLGGAYLSLVQIAGTSKSWLKRRLPAPIVEFISSTRRRIRPKTTS
jgi:CelD/BcsL family acetyltransferase involved in cellulose biosynthesis